MNDEPDIIQACLRGDRTHYGTLVKRHAAAVRAFLMAKLGSPERAEEAAQETFVRAFAGLHGLKDHERFVSWVLGIAANVAMEDARKRQNDGSVHVEREAPSEPRGEDGMAAAVRALPEPYRGAVWLRYWAGLSCEAAAREQGVSVGTFTKRLSRAHAILHGVVEGGEEKERVHELR
jgi:RNA polymerase sigma-70 factor (ECF subfamily)